MVAFYNVHHPGENFSLAIHLMAREAWRKA